MVSFTCAVPSIEWSITHWQFRTLGTSVNGAISAKVAIPFARSIIGPVAANIVGGVGLASTPSSIPCTIASRSCTALFACVNGALSAPVAIPVAISIIEISRFTHTIVGVVSFACAVPSIEWPITHWLNVTFGTGIFGTLPAKVTVPFAISKVRATRGISSAVAPAGIPFTFTSWLLIALITGIRSTLPASVTVPFAISKVTATRGVRVTKSISSIKRPVAIGFLVTLRASVLGTNSTQVAVKLAICIVDIYARGVSVTCTPSGIPCSLAGRGCAALFASINGAVSARVAIPFAPSIVPRFMPRKVGFARSISSVEWTSARIRYLLGYIFSGADKELIMHDIAAGPAGLGGFFSPFSMVSVLNIAGAGLVDRSSGLVARSTRNASPCTVGRFSHSIR